MLLYALLIVPLLFAAEFGARQWNLHFGRGPAHFEAVFLEVSQSKEIDEPWDVYPEIAREVPDDIMPEMLARIGRWEPSDARDSVWQELIKKWSESSLESALNYVQSLPQPDVRLEGLGLLMEKWTTKDPDAAERCILALNPTNERRWLRSRWLKALAPNDPDRALATLRAESLPPASAREVFFALAKKDRAEATTAIEDLDPAYRRDAIYALAVSGTSSDLSGTVEWLEGLPAGAVADEAWTRVIEVFAKASPPDAVACAMRNLKAPALIDSLGRCLAEWSKKDEPAALAWFRGLSDTDLQSAIYARGLGSVHIWSPPTALKLLQEFGLKGLHPNTVQNIVLPWMNTDIEAVREWSMTQPDGPGRGVVWRYLATRKTVKDRSAAFAWVEKLPNCESKADAYGGIAQALWPNSLSAEQALEIGRLLKRCPESPTRAKIAGEISRYLSNSSPKHAWEWIESLSPGSMRAAAISEGVPCLVTADPDRMVRLAASIHDEKERQGVYRSIVFYWLDEKHQRGLKWIAKSALPDEIKAEARSKK